MMQKKMELTWIFLVPNYRSYVQQNNSSDAKGFLLDTINYWLENDTEKSWSKLAEAVEDCGHKLLAETARSMESV